MFARKHASPLSFTDKPSTKLQRGSKNGEAKGREFRIGDRDRSRLSANARTGCGRAIVRRCV